MTFRRWQRGMRGCMRIFGSFKGLSGSRIKDKYYKYPFEERVGFFSSKSKRQTLWEIQMTVLGGEKCIRTCQFCGNDNLLLRFMKI